ncbi:response regulator transcription factor [Sulfurimonas sp. MAG313]|nr:response regulator transcription factor [Sulfurimonas sp. MAG313]MDF1880479.1 response regulator transcription factor [Sulfurimonas sp. MAG313]
MRRCALVEDDTVFLNLMHNFFEKKAWICDDFIDVNSTLESTKKTVYDLYIIDINLPEADGISLVKELRLKFPQVPIIMVSGYNDIETIMRAYEVGCDEYLKKPFDLKELGIKVSKLMDDDLLALSDTVKYDVSGRALYIDNKEIHLSQKESNLIHTFMTNINRALTHDYLESVIWGGVEDNGHALRNLVLRLRKRIGTGIIDTVQGKGYILRLNQ